MLARVLSLLKSSYIVYKCNVNDNSCKYLAKNTSMLYNGGVYKLMVYHQSL